MKRNFTLIAALIAFTTGFSQLKGRCVNENGNGISYVNITVKGKTLGTVSNEKGDFFLENETLDENDSLIFSHVTFETQTIGLKKIPEKIEMYSKVLDLDEVVVSNKKNRKIKEIIVGTKTESGNVILQFVSNNLGSEVGKVIKVKKNKVYDLKKVFFNIVELGYKSATFRMNFYTINKGIPETTKINHVDNVVTISKPGLVEIDLSNQNLSFDKSFIASIEWIDFENDNENENKVIHISSTVFSGPFANRDNVNIPWKIDKVKYNVGIGIHLLIDSYAG